MEKLMVRSFDAIREPWKILELDKLVDTDLDIYAGNVLIARGKVVVIDEKFGIRVTETCSKFL